MTDIHPPPYPSTNDDESYVLNLFDLLDTYINDDAQVKWL